MVYPLKVRFPTFGYKPIFLSTLLRFEYPEVSGTLLLTVPSLPAPTQTTVNVQVVAYMGYRTKCDFLMLAKNYVNN